MKRLSFILLFSFISAIMTFGANISELKNKAEQGNAEAQYSLGVCYRCGDGVEKNLEEAIKWYKKAAEQGYAKAQYNLAVCYDSEYGVEKNVEKAVKWYRKSAEQGYARAQHNLGICYYNADGVIQNNVKALAWVCAAYANGDNGTTKAIRIIRQKMTSAQIEQALKLAKSYTNGIFDESKESMQLQIFHYLDSKQQDNFIKF